MMRAGAMRVMGNYIFMFVNLLGESKFEYSHSSLKNGVRTNTVSLRCYPASHCRVYIYTSYNLTLY